jgi:TLD
VQIVISESIPDQMERPDPAALTIINFAADNNSLEKDLKVSSNDINRLVKAVFNEYNEEFIALKRRQQKLESYASRITEYCRKESEGRNFLCHKEESILKLNVGGEDINIRRTAVLHDGSDDSILSILLLNRWAYRFVRNQSGRIFLNLNPAWIAPAINVMRDPSVVSSTRRLATETSVDQKSGFDALQSYYNLGFLYPQPTVLFVLTPSTIPSMHNKEYMEALLSFVQPELSAEEESVDVHLDLIYRGSRDGFYNCAVQPYCTGAHPYCTGEYRTVFVIEDSEKNVFGGYFNGIAGAESSFLFSLTGEEKPAKFTRKVGHLRSPFVGLNLVNFGGDLIVQIPGEPSYSTLGGDYHSNSRAHLNVEGISTTQYFMCRELEAYRILDPSTKALRAAYEILQQAMIDSTTLARTELTCPLHSWILAAVNRCGYQCSDFDAKLIYTAERNWQPAAIPHTDFVTSCNGKAMTVCIIRDNRGHTLGCFSDTEWTSTPASVPTANSFTFSLGGAVACHSMQRRTLIETGPQNLISFGDDFNVKPNCTINLIKDGKKVIASNGIGLTVHGIAMYEVVPRAAFPDNSTVKVLSDKLSTDTRDIVENIRKMDEQVRQAELKVLMELLQVEHLSSSRKDRDTKIGLKAEWRKILDTAADCRLDTSGKKTLHMLGEVMARFNITGSNAETKGEAVDNDDEVVSYNVGGTIIAVLRSTLLRQAPNSAFASRFSGRWSEQANEDMEDGHICLVRYLRGQMSIVASVISPDHD